MEVVALLGERLENLFLHLLARVIREGFHYVERDRLCTCRRADLRMDEPIAQSAFDRRNRGAEGLRDGLWRLAVDLHHPRESLKLVDGTHRRLGNVLGERQRGGNVAIVRDQAAVDLGAAGDPLGRLVRDQFHEGRMTPAACEDAELSIDLLNEQRLEEAQYRDAGLQMRDVVGGVGPRGLSPHIRGMGDEIADGDGNGLEGLSHEMSFSGFCGTRTSRAA